MSSAVAWQRSSFCGTNACIAVLVDGPVVHIRSTSDSEPPLTVTRAEWAAFIQGAKAGEFDPDRSGS